MTQITQPMTNMINDAQTKTPSPLDHPAPNRSNGLVIAQPITTLLKQWEDEGRLTPLDRHFAQELSHIHQETSPLFLLICALLSQQLSKQHTCLPLAHIQLNNPLQEKSSQCQITCSHETLADKLSSFSAIININRAETNSNINQAPMILDNGYLYLQRYYQFERQVSYKLNALSADNSNAIDEKNIRHIATTLDLLYPKQNINTPVFDWQKIATATALSKKLAVITGGPGTGKTTTVTKLLFLLCLQHASHSEHANAAPLTIKLVAPTGKAAARLSESIKASKHRLKAEITQWPNDIHILASHHSHAGTELGSSHNNTTSEDVDKPYAFSAQAHLNALAQVPEEGATLHRLLGVIPNSHKFRHDEANPLRLDLLVVDEASMVDLPMMYKLLHALPPHARLILLGDQDQLASVEAGAVLADICAGLALQPNEKTEGQWRMRYSASHAALLSRLCDEDLSACIDNRTQQQPALFGDSLCMLMHSHRFKGDAGIGQLATGVNQSNKQRIKQVWQAGYQELCWLEHQIHTRGNVGLTALLEQSTSAYGRYLTMVKNQLQSADTIIECFNEYRILCAMRSGEYGVDGINQSVTQALWQAKLIQPTQEFYAGRPIIIQSNDYNLGLFNGDIGLILPDKNRDNKLMAHFIQADASMLSVLPARLPQHDTCYAMTVHKSQGSEFNQVALVLPVNPSPSQKQLLTKELVYTGITRAKQHFTCLGSEKVFEQASLKATQRASGLARRLWNA